jgi:hypothetical protein
MVGATKAAGGYGITSLPSTTSTAAPAAAAGNPIDQLKSAVDALAQNPIIRALLGNSGFDGLGAQGKGQGLALGHAKQAEKAAGAGEAQTPEQGLQKLLEGLQKFVELLGQLLGKQAGGEQPAQGAGGAEGAQGAGGAEGAQGGEGAAPAQNAPPAAPPAAPAAAEGAQGAEGAEEAKSPMQQLIETLTKLIEKLVEFQKAMQAAKQQQGAPEGVAVGEPNGAGAPQGIAVGEPNGAAPAAAVV